MSESGSMPNVSATLTKRLYANGGSSEGLTDRAYSGILVLYARSGVTTRHAINASNCLLAHQILSHTLPALVESDHYGVKKIMARVSSPDVPTLHLIIF